MPPQLAGVCTKSSLSQSTATVFSMAPLRHDGTSAAKGFLTDYFEVHGTILSYVSLCLPYSCFLELDLHGFVASLHVKRRPPQHKMIQAANNHLIFGGYSINSIR